MKSLIILILFMGGAAQATPKKYSNCELQSQIERPENSSGFYMSKDCTKAYVLPPQRAVVEFGNMESDLGSSLCEATQSLLDYTAQEMISIKEARTRIEEREEEAQEGNSGLRRLKSKCNNLIDQQLMAEEKVLEFDGQIKLAQRKLSRLQKSKKECEEQNGEDHFFCSMEDFDIQDMKEKLTEAEEIKDQLLFQKETFEIRSSICDRRVEIRLARITHNDSDYQRMKGDLLQSLVQYQRLLNQQIEAESKTRGGLMAVTFLGGHNDMVEEFRDVNEVLDGNVVFEAMPLKKAQIHFRLIEDGEKAGYPIILKSHINGLNVASENQTLVDTSLQTHGEAEAQKLFGSGVSGNIVVNRLALCKMMLQKDVDSGNDLTAGDVATLLLPTISYDYEVQVERRIKVAYAESHFYQLIKKSTKKNGLFKSKTINSMYEKSEAEKWIDIEFYSEDGDHEFVDSTQMAMDIRAEYAQAALMKVAKSYLSTEQVQLIEAGPSGAEGASSAIKRCKHPYCQAAGIVLDIASSLFGGNTQEANMTREVKAMEKTRISDLKMVSHAGSQTFKTRPNR